MSSSRSSIMFEEDKDKVERELLERELAEEALRDRPCQHDFYRFKKNESRRKRGVSQDPVDYKDYGLIAIHRDVESWTYVADDPQLATVVEEIVNTFNPNLSIELLLYNVLASNSECATCLVRYLVNYYSSNRVCEHIKTTLRNSILWTVLAGFVPCIFVPWAKVRSIGSGLSSRAALNALVYSDLKLTNNNRHRCSSYVPKTAPDMGCCKRSRLTVVHNALSQREAAAEAVQELRAHEQALPSVLDVELDDLVESLRLLMSKSVPKPQAAVVCKILQSWITSDSVLRLNPMKETELKMATVGLWGVMKTFEHGRCPIVPECSVSSCLAFFDTQMGLVTASVDGVLYRHIPMWESCWTSGGDVSTLAKRVHTTVKRWASLFKTIISSLTKSSSRQVFTSGGTDRSSLSHLANVILASRGDQSMTGLSLNGNASGRPMLDNLSRFMTAGNETDMFGLPASDLPSFLLRSGVGGTSSEHKAASVSHSLSKMMSSMISEWQDMMLVTKFLDDVTKGPEKALAELKQLCKNSKLLHTAKLIVRKLTRDKDSSQDDDGDEEEVGSLTELGADVKLVCSYPSTVSIAHLEETLSLWTNFWRSALSGFSQFNRRHNTIQYNNRDTVRELESGSPVHVFHTMLVTLLNTSGLVFADNLSGRKPDASLTVNDVMLTRDSLHPVAYGLLLANKLGFRPSDVRCEHAVDPFGDPFGDPEPLLTSPDNRSSSSSPPGGNGLPGRDCRLGPQAPGPSDTRPSNGALGPRSSSSSSGPGKRPHPSPRQPEPPRPKVVRRV